MPQWIDLGPASELPPGAKNCLEVDDRRIVVMNIDGQVHATSNVCPHAGLPLGEGELHGKVLVCPFHGYAYDVETGCNIDFPNEERRLRRYEARVHEGRLQINIEGVEPD